MATQINNVTVGLERDPDDFRRLVVIVRVTSRKRPEINADNTIDPGATSGRDHLVQLVGAAGGACAEYLGKKYGDNIDPAACARDAIQALGEEARMVAEMKESLPKLLKRLRYHAAAFSDRDRETSQKLQWIASHGGSITPADMSWIRSRIAMIHSGHLN